MDANEIKKNRIRNTAIGGVTGYAVGSKIEEIVKKYPERVVYSGIGGILGYFLAKMKEKGTYKKVADYVKDKAGYGPKNPTQQ
jgi:hypothetical protein